VTLLAASPLWYLTRGAGVVALVLLTVSVLLGLVTWSRWRNVDWPRYITAGLHRNVALLAVSFVALHVLTSVVDGYAPIRLVDAVVPFVSQYRPLWLGLGALAFDLLLALIVTSLLRRRLGWRAWRAVHWLTYGCFGVAVVHGLGTGSDPHSLWFVALTAACVAAVLAAAIGRILRARSGDRMLRRAAVGGALLGTFVLAVWAGVGPLRAGWATRAGTPTRLLSGAGPSSVQGVAQLPAAPFELRFEGQAAADVSSSNSAKLDVAAALDKAAGQLGLEFAGRAENGVLVPTSIVVRYGDQQDPARFIGDGRLTSRNEVVANVTDGRTSLRLTIQLDIDLSAGTASGVVSGVNAV